MPWLYYLNQMRGRVAGRFSHTKQPPSCLTITAEARGVCGLLCWPAADYDCHGGASAGGSLPVRARMLSQRQSPLRSRAKAGAPHGLARAAHRSSAMDSSRTRASSWRW